MESMVASLNQEATYQNIHHFLHSASWDHQKVLDKIAVDFVENCNNGAPISLIIDEKACAKKGNKSAAVARQYCGNLGKVENCQVGVFSALFNGKQVGTINVKLYLPQSWTDDVERCKKAYIPVNEQGLVPYKTKIDLALELIKEATELKIPFDWVNFDGFYGRDMDLLSSLMKDQIDFVADIPSNLLVSLTAFSLEVPPKKGKRGPTPKLLRPTVELIKVAQIAQQATRQDWQEIEFRKGYANQPLKADFIQKHIWVCNQQKDEILSLILLIRKDIDGKLKYSLIGSKKQLSIKECAFRQSNRYFIERCFQDQNQNLGMGDYQTRSYVAYLRHMTLIAMAMQYVNQKRIDNREDLPNISVADVVKLIVCSLSIQPKPYDTLLQKLIQKYPNKPPS